MNSKIHFFVGPSLFGLDMNLFPKEQCEILPPVKRGDIDKLVESHSPSIAVIVDGTFHSYPSVSHKEINDAIKMGWKIWGLSSMGAIRAAEMKIFGMRGYGSVYDLYVNDDDFSDDEVTLIHDTDHPYTPLSIPMVQIREFIDSLIDRELISTKDAKIVTSRLKNIWYGYRTKERLKELLLESVEEYIVDVELNRIDEFNIKQKDLTDFLTNKPYNGINIQNYKEVYGGIPFVNNEFKPKKLLTLAAITRQQIDQGSYVLEQYAQPNIACAVYEKKLGQRFRENSSIEMPSDKRRMVDECIEEIIYEVPEWKDMFAIPIEYRYLTNNQTSLTNPLAPQLIYLGELCFSSRNNLKEVIIHEYSHVWCALMCEIKDFEKPQSPADMYLPSGTGPKTPRGMLLAGLFAAAAVNYYSLSGRIVEEKVKTRFDHLNNYLKGTIVSLYASENVTQFGLEITKDLDEYFS